jgi:hypothetical protein
MCRYFLRHSYLTLASVLFRAGQIWGGESLTGKVIGISDGDAFAAVNVDRLSMILDSIPKEREAFDAVGFELRIQHPTVRLLRN